ncbi:MAG: 4-(cytidine 5'-diphospho)-2-C-methyl-D-erythritol kinase [Paracoccaceae bacterium]
MTNDGFAPAKINLTLHVTGRRADGYHLLDSLVVFAGVGDRITAQPDERLDLQITGPMAGALVAASDNLVLRAAQLLNAGMGARIVLEKHLPVASGIGGGSSDAAAALRVLSRMWSARLPDTASLATLGADVPVCLTARPARMTGIGEHLADVPPLPEFWMVLANPNRGIATPDVFHALSGCFGAAMPEVSAFPDAIELASFLRDCRNDLQPPAERLLPVISGVCDALAAQPGCLLARMSGSGATCFGIFSCRDQSDAAARNLHRAEPAWWVQSSAALV